MQQIEKDWVFHEKSKYIKAWNEINKQFNLHNLCFYNKIKLRFFSYTSNRLYSNVRSHKFTIITTSPINNDYHSLELWAKQLDKKVSLKTLYGTNINGYYTTKTHLVLCGPPHAKTLINSYKNNKADTLLKLMNITGLSINKANDLICLAEEII